jgi:hypothetical protein
MKIVRRLNAHDKKRVAARQLWHCEMCKFVLDETYEVDHIVPLHKGGEDNIENCRALCCSCHRRITVQQESERIKNKCILRKSITKFPPNICARCEMRVSPFFVHKCIWNNFTLFKWKCLNVFHTECILSRILQRGRWRETEWRCSFDGCENVVHRRFACRHSWHRMLFLDETYDLKELKDKLEVMGDKITEIIRDYIAIISNISSTFTVTLLSWRQDATELGSSIKKSGSKQSTRLRPWRNTYLMNKL